MSDQINKVLIALKRRPKRGICATEFPPGFPIRSRIADLRKKMDIESIPDARTNLVRYRIVEES